MAPNTVLLPVFSRGQFHLMQDGGAANVQVAQTLSDSDDDNDSAWEGRLGDQYKPPGTAQGLSGKESECSMGTLGLVILELLEGVFSEKLD